MIDMISDLEGSADWIRMKSPDIQKFLPLRPNKKAKLATGTSM
jgi:hypothetical protein